MIDKFISFMEKGDMDMQIVYTVGRGSPGRKEFTNHGVMVP